MIDRDAERLAHDYLVLPSQVIAPSTRRLALAYIRLLRDRNRLLAILRDNTRRWRRRSV
jgi:hypothetical protein